jgi:RNA polymerase sigma-70 factor (ECF subfamily)
VSVEPLDRPGTPSNFSERTTSNGSRQPARAHAVGESFEAVVLPHLDAAYRLARWLTRNEHDAEDVVQDASLRAFRYFRTFTGGNGRAWFLRIVRNICSGRRGGRVHAPTDPFDEERHSSARPASDPETMLLQTDDVKLIEQALRNVPDRFRELLVLRELEGLSYRELADVMGIPIGSVMSGLSRARQAFRTALNSQAKQHGIPERTHPRENAPRAAQA